MKNFTKSAKTLKLFSKFSLPQVLIFSLILISCPNPALQTENAGDKNKSSTITASGNGNFVSAYSSASSTDGTGRPLMVLTALPFELDGERDVDNFKFHWNDVENASFYRLFVETDGNWQVVTENLFGRQAITGNLYGTMFDVYDLGNSTRNYKIVAYDSSENEIASAGPLTCKGFADNTSKIFDNTKQSLFDKADKSLYYDGKYFRYIYNRSADNAVSYEEQWSTNGFEPWTSSGIVISGNPDDFADGTNDERYCEYLSAGYNSNSGCKLESTSYQQRKDGTVINWSHYENGKNYSLGQVICIYGIPGSGVFKAESAPYHPGGNESRDLNSFVDSDGSAYIIGSTNVAQTLYKLDSSWTKLDESFTPITLYSGSREAPCFRKLGDYYFLFSSEQQGWFPTQGAYIVGKTFAELASCKLNNLGNRATFGGQSGQIEHFGDNLGMMANRWSQGWNLRDLTGSPEYTEFLGTSGIAFAQRYLPISYCEGYAFYDYFFNIHYDDTTNTVIPVQRGKLLSLGKADARNSSESSAKDGENLFTVDLTTDGISYSNDISPSWGSKKNYYQSSAGSEYYVTINFHEAVQVKEVDVTFRQVGGSEPASHFLIEGSTGGTSNWITISDRTDNYISGFVETLIDDQTKYRAVRIRVIGMHDVNHKTSGNWWGRGIHEISVYGFND